MKMGLRRLSGTRSLLAFVALCLFAGLPSVADAEAWDVAFVASLDKAASNYWNPSLLVVLGTFTYDHEDLASPFSRWLIDDLHSLLPRTKALRLFDKAAAAAMDPDLREAYSALFSEGKVDAILYGRFFEEGRAVRVHYELTGLSDGALVGAGDILVPRSELPEGLEVAPPREARKVRVELSSLDPASTAIPPGGGEGLRVAVSTDRGDGAAYKEGESLAVLVTVSKPAWLKVYHVDVAGKVQLIWPNRFSGPPRPLAAGAIVRIPGANDPFSFVLGPPFGTEFIKVVASTSPFSSTEEDFVDLEGSPRESIARGLRVTASAPGERAENLASYLILEN